MSGLKDCGVIIIFCFPISPIINYSNVFLPSDKFWQSTSKATNAQSWHQGGLAWGKSLQGGVLTDGVEGFGLWFIENYLVRLLKVILSSESNVFFWVKSIFLYSFLEEFVIEMNDIWKYLGWSSKLSQLTSTTNIKRNIFQKWRIETCGSVPALLLPVFSFCFPKAGTSMLWPQCLWHHMSQLSVPIFFR